VNDHICDRKGPPEKIIDESGDEPIARICPTCSVCRKPQVFNARTQQIIAKLSLLSAEDRELIARLVDRFASTQPAATEVRSQAATLIAYLKQRH
jgi:hypothetical protein